MILPQWLYWHASVHSLRMKYLKHRPQFIKDERHAATSRGPLHILKGIPNPERRLQTGLVNGLSLPCWTALFEIMLIRDFSSTSPECNFFGSRALFFGCGCSFEMVWAADARLISIPSQGCQIPRNGRHMAHISTVVRREQTSLFRTCHVLKWTPASMDSFQTATQPF